MRGGNELPMLAPLSSVTAGLMYEFFATCPQGLEALLEAELKGLGLPEAKGTRGGVAFASPKLADAYRVCLHSHLAHRLLLSLARFRASGPDAVYAAVQDIDWSAHLAADGSFLVDAKLRDSTLGNAHFMALKVKDAIVDQFRAATGQRPSVDVHNPDLRLNLFVHRQQAELSLDLSGGGLRRVGMEDAAHWRGGLGAAALYLGDWPARLAQGEPLVILGAADSDMVISAALMAAGQAPGLLLPKFGFERWQSHVPALWRRLCEEAQGAVRPAADAVIEVWEEQGKLLRSLRQQCEDLHLVAHLRCCAGALDQGMPPAAPGLVLWPPPENQRPREREARLAQIGALLRRRFGGYALVRVGLGDEACDAWSLRPQAALQVRRGSRSFQLRTYSIPVRRPSETVTAPEQALLKPQALALSADSAAAQMLVNRLSKNARHLGKWARRNAVSCYRLYDADLPEYAAAIDLYQSDLLWVVVQEYAPPAQLDPETVDRRRDEILAATAQVLQIPLQRIVLKQRKRQKGAAQYEKLGRSRQFYIVREGSLRLWVNFTDYLDTGLFLDHRNTRLELGSKAAGKHVLNLFAYTGVATLHMVAGGAKSSTTVDLSRTYLDWAQRNLELNNLAGPAHQLVQADCINWLETAAANPAGKRYGLIFMDPPTFSTSKKMEAVLDVQRDHVRLIRAAAALLRPGGELYFSNNFRRFKLDSAALADLQIDNISGRSLPEDFRRNPKIHQCYLIRQAGA